MLYVAAIVVYCCTYVVAPLKMAYHIHVCCRIKALLTRWHYPNVTRAYFTQVLEDVMKERKQPCVL